MGEYAPPIGDMGFVLDAICDLSAIAALPGADASPDFAQDVLQQAGRLASEVWAPLDAPGDRAGAQLVEGQVRMPAGFADAYRAFCDGGWNGVAAPKALGGMGLPLCLATAVQEIWQTANMALGLCTLVSQAAISLLGRHGSEAQQARYLSRLISGVWAGCMSMTEPQAGSDLGAIRSRAVPDGDGYRLTGQKIFITYGDHDLAENIVHMVLARTPGAPAGSKGLSLFAVPKFLVGPDGERDAPNDVRCVSLEHKLGLHASPTAVMAYGDNGGAWAEIIGGVGQGLPLMFTMMNEARLGVGVQGVAVCERAYQSALRHARSRVQASPSGANAPATIDHHPDVRRMLMCLRAHAEATRALVYYTAAAADVATLHPKAEQRARAQRRLDLLTPVAKAWCSDTGVEMASLGIQVHGGMGYIEETGAAQILRDARVTPIYEGTNGIQAIDLVRRKLLRDGGAAMQELLDDMDASNASYLGHGVAALSWATDWAVRSGPTPEVLASATTILRLMGVVVSGWLMARAGARARAGTAQDAPLLRAKSATAAFFAQHVLSQAPALAEPIVAGGAAVLALAPEEL